MTRWLMHTQTHTHTQTQLQHTHLHTTHAHTRTHTHTHHTHTHTHKHTHTRVNPNHPHLNVIVKWAMSGAIAVQQPALSKSAAAVDTDADCAFHCKMVFAIIAIFQTQRWWRMWEGRMLVQGAMPGISLYPASKLLRQDQEAHTLRRLNICRLARTVCMYTVMTVYLVISQPTIPYIHRVCVYIYSWVGGQKRTAHTHLLALPLPFYMYIIKSVLVVLICFFFHFIVFPGDTGSYTCKSP